MLRRILGVVIVVSSLVVLIALLALAIAVGPAVDSIAAGLDNTLTLTDDTLSTVSATLEQTQATLVAVNDTISTASQTTDNLAQTLADSKPLLEGITSVITDQAPNSVEAVQAAIPNIAQVAGVVDDALTALSNFGINQTIPIPFNPITLDFDLGIDYKPVEPFDETLTAMGSSLDGLPQQLRSLRSDLEVTTTNLGVIGENIQTASGDLGDINAQVAAFIPLLDDYLATIDQIGATLDQIHGQVNANLSTIKLVGTILPLAIALTQFAPLVVGWDLITGKRDPEAIAKKVEEELAEDMPAGTVVVAKPVDEDLSKTAELSSDDYDDKGDHEA